MLDGIVAKSISALIIGSDSITTGIFCLIAYGFMDRQDEIKDAVLMIANPYLYYAKRYYNKVAFDLLRSQVKESLEIAISMYNFDNLDENENGDFDVVAYFTVNNRGERRALSYKFTMACVGDNPRKIDSWRITEVKTKLSEDLLR